MNSIQFISGKPLTPGKVVCIGKNYPDHIAEMRDGPPPSEPVIFLKPNSAIAFGPAEIPIPNSFGLLHHEVELCFVVGKRCKAIGQDEALSAIAGYAVGIDLTLRDRQAAAKKSGGPWDLAKGFDNSAVFGTFREAESVADPLNLNISLKVNGKVKQSSNTGNMIRTPAEILSFVSLFMTLEDGDIFMCGTPAGVGALNDKDTVEAAIDGLPKLKFKVVRA